MLTCEERLERLQGQMKLLEETEFYECALSQASYIKGMAGAWYSDGGITADDWRGIWAAVDACMTTKFTLKSVVQGVLS